MFLKAFESIVVGIDFSTYSQTVVKQALRLAELWEAKLVLVHAFNEPVSVKGNYYFPPMKQMSQSDYIEQIKDYYDLKKNNIEFVVKCDAPHRLLRVVAKKQKRPLIMIGYKGQGRLTEFLFGSTAQNLISTSNYPVWIQRGKKVVDPNRILIPHDLSRESSRSLDLVKKLELLRPLKYEVFFVRQRPYAVLDYPLYASLEHEQLLDVQKKTQDLLAKYPKLPFTSTKGDVTEKIVQKTKQFDMVLLTHHNPENYYSSTETVRLMRRVEVPLLVS